MWVTKNFVLRVKIIFLVAQNALIKNFLFQGPQDFKFPMQGNSLVFLIKMGERATCQS